jgi:hypothetical protein
MVSRIARKNSSCIQHSSRCNLSYTLSQAYRGRQESVTQDGRDFSFVFSLREFSEWLENLLGE